MCLLPGFNYIQDVLSDKIAERSLLGERIEQANEQDKADLRRQADDLTYDIQQLRNTLEIIAIGGIDTSLFQEVENEQDNDWRQDITLIAQPVVDSLKELTDKPRKLKESSTTPSACSRVNLTSQTKRLPISSRSLIKTCKAI